MGEDSLLEEAFKPGSTVTLEFVANGGIIKRFDTKVEDIESEYLVLQTPIVNNAPVPIEEGQELTLRRFEELLNQAYVTNVFVIENRPAKIPLLICSKPREIGKTSMRRFSRFSAELSCHFAGAGEKSVTGQILDISLSGISGVMVSEPRLKEGSLLAVTVHLPGETELSMTGELVRCYKVPDKGKIGFAIDIKEISSTMLEVLKNYLFQRQMMRY
ncbi:MAG: flagellar brake protein [Bacillota bacterium]|nr:flagellar brake protein [Bacillota bacterium]